MNLISTFIIWIWLLGISLVIPTSLPAGGSQKTTIEYRENNSSAPLIPLQDFNLLSSAYINASILTRVQAGTPIDVLQVWESNESGKWLLVNIRKQRDT